MLVACLVLFLSLVAPQPATATLNPNGTAATTASTAAQVAQYGIIASILSGIVSVFRFLQQVVLPSGFSAVTSAINGFNLTLNNQYSNVADYLAQANQGSKRQSIVAEEQADSVLADQDTVCAVNQLQQHLRELEVAMRQLSLADNALDIADCQGPNANCPSPKRNYWKIQDECQLGLTSPTDSGDLAQQMGCAAPADITIANRQTALAAALAWHQYPLASACVLPDGFRFFGPNPPAACRGGSSSTGPGAAQANADPAQNSLAWAAFYKFCQSLASGQQTGIVTQGRPITSNDIERYLANSNAIAATGSAQQYCKEALWQRTACPASNPSMARALGGNSTPDDNCHALQVRVCNDLKTAPNPQRRDLAGTAGQRQTSTQTGMGISGDAALQNCERDGLSLMKIYHILANRCADNNYVQV
ncbi:MAG: hypothetical protein AB7H77_08135, partial [Bdellovibrionales bacterium]